MSDSSTLVSSPSVPQAVPDGTAWIPGGTFRMGSDVHYPEEAPAQAASVDGFWMDQCPVTDREFETWCRPPAIGRSRKSRLIPPSTPGESAS